MKTKTKWTTFVEYINKQSIGDTIYRQNLLSSTDEYYKDRCTTTDNYRNWLILSKHMEKTNKEGEYKLLKYVNNSMNIIKKLAYDDEFRINQDRFEKISEILNEDKCDNGIFFEHAKQN